MATFANPASDARNSGAEYTRRLLEVLGDRDPIEVQSGLVAAVESAVAGISETSLRTAEAPGKWSVMEVVQHLADTELVYGYRMRMILAHPSPAIEGYDQDAWAGELRYNEVPLAQALEQMRVLRGANLRLLQGLSEQQLDRYGMHSERGRESIRQIMRLIAAHDLVHRRQIARIMASRS
ncbi:MAG: DinB family protein [Anaerolineae bacterium]|nr:DinB family protein [Gemmatimonadaceae bacterium]